jgi:hypothetical protein
VTGPATRSSGSSYARISRHYVPAAILVVALAAGISTARRELFPTVDGLVGDIAGGVVLAIVAMALIGLAIVRPFERHMHERRRVSAERERTYRADTERRGFERRLSGGLDLCDDEVDLLTTIGRALAQVAPGATAELLLTDDASGELDRAASNDDGTVGCSVPTPDECPATRRGTLQAFADSDAIDACPWLRGRPGGRIGAVCVPVSITGRALGVVHVTHEVSEPPTDVLQQQLTALADHVGARIGVLRLTAAAASTASVLVPRTGEGGATTDGPPLECSAVTGAVPTG